VSAFAALAEPTRRRILDELCAGDRTVGELVAELQLPQPNVSKHLRVLREAGLVAAAVDGPLRRYRLEAGGLAEIESWLQPYRRLWTGQLDRLERHLDEERDR
jgi:DNA-binding transcriptional ArsR family regulator